MQGAATHCCRFYPGPAYSSVEVVCFQGKLPGKIVEQIFLEDMLRHMRHSQHGSTKCKYCLANVVTFYDGVT